MRTYLNRYTLPNTAYELKAFVHGMLTFRSATPARYGYPVKAIYESGRDTMHAFTLRLFED